MLPYAYSKTELETLLKSITLLIDTREQENKHITDYLDKHFITYQHQKLDYGDYSFILPANTELGIIKDITFKNNLAIERKASLEELSNNLTHKRSEFENELLRANTCKLYLMVENATYADILNHKYKTEYNPKAFIAALKTYESRYNISLNFLDSACAANFIFYTCYYYLREYLKA